MNPDEIYARLEGYSEDSYQIYLALQDEINPDKRAALMAEQQQIVAAVQQLRDDLIILTNTDWDDVPF